jgi:YD repeat-containing protein
MSCALASSASRIFGCVTNWRIVGPAKWLFLIVLLGGVWITSPAWSQSIRCIEDGGSYQCRDPGQGTPVTYAVPDDPFIRTSYLTESDMWNDMIAPYCAGTFVHQKTDFSLASLTVGTLAWPGTAVFSKVITLDGYQGNCALNQHFVVDLNEDRYVPMSCPSGYTGASATTTNHPLGFCYRTAVQPTQKNQCPQCVGDPIDVFSGTLLESQADFKSGGDGALEFKRTYNYLGTDISFAPLNGSLGRGWTHTFERRLSSFPSGTVRAARADGTDRIFVAVSGGGYREYGTAVDQLFASTDATGNIVGWTFIDEDDTREAYDSQGLLQTITVRGGEVLSLSYSTASTPANVAPAPGLLLTVADAFGHQLSFTYSPQGLLATMTDPNGAVYTYANGNGVLASVAYPDSTTLQYLYNESSYTGGAYLPYALTGVVDQPVHATRHLDTTVLPGWRFLRSLQVVLSQPVFPTGPTTCR